MPTMLARPLIFLAARLLVVLLTVAIAGVLWSSTDQVFRFDSDHTVGAATILSFVLGCLEFVGIGFLASSWRRGTVTRPRFFIVHAIPSVLWVILLILGPYALANASGTGAGKVLCRIGGSTCMSSQLFMGVVVMDFVTWLTAGAGLIYVWRLPSDLDFAEKRNSEKEPQTHPSDSKDNEVRLSMQPIGTHSNLSINYLESSSRGSLQRPRSHSPATASPSAANSVASLPDAVSAGSAGPHVPIAPPKLGAPTKSFEDARYVSRPRMSSGPRRASKLSSVAMSAIPATPDSEKSPPPFGPVPTYLDTRPVKVKRRSWLGSLKGEMLVESPTESSASTPSPEPQDGDSPTSSSHKAAVEKRDSKKMAKRPSKRETKTEFKVNSVAKVQHEIEEGEIKPLPIVPRGEWSTGDDLYETGPMITQKPSAEFVDAEEHLPVEPVKRHTLTEEHLYTPGPMVSPLDSELVPRGGSPVLTRQQKIAEATSKLEGQDHIRQPLKSVSLPDAVSQHPPRSSSHHAPESLRRTGPQRASTAKPTSPKGSKEETMNVYI